MKNEGGQANADAQAHHPNEASPKGFVFGVERVIHSVLFTAFYSQRWAGRRWRQVRKDVTDGAMQLVQWLVGMRLRLNAVSTANDQGLFEVGFTTA